MKSRGSCGQKIFKKSAHLLDYSAVSLKDDPLRVAFSRQRIGHQLLVKEFNKALKSMRTDGTLEEILQSHGVSSFSQN